MSASNFVTLRLAFQFNRKSQRVEVKTVERGVYLPSPYWRKGVAGQDKHPIGLVDRAGPCCLTGSWHPPVGAGHKDLAAQVAHDGLVSKGHHAT